MQLQAGTVIWFLPDGHTYVTTSGSALLFPSLCAPTGDPPKRDAAGADRCGDRTAMMPLRTRAPAQNRAHRIATERAHSREQHLAAEAAAGLVAAAENPDPPPDPDEPPPFWVLF